MAPELSRDSVKNLAVGCLDNRHHSRVLQFSLERDGVEPLLYGFQTSDDVDAVLLPDLLFDGSRLSPFTVKRCLTTCLIFGVHST